MTWHAAGTRTPLCRQHRRATRMSEYRVRYRSGLASGTAGSSAVRPCRSMSHRGSRAFVRRSEITTASSASTAGSPQMDPIGVLRPKSSIGCCQACSWKRGDRSTAAVDQRTTAPRRRGMSSCRKGDRINAASSDRRRTGPCWGQTATRRSTSAPRSVLTTVPTCTSTTTDHSKSTKRRCVFEGPRRDPFKERSLVGEARMLVSTAVSDRRT